MLGFLISVWTQSKWHSQIATFAKYFSFFVETQTCSYQFVSILPWSRSFRSISCWVWKFQKIAKNREIKAVCVERPALILFSRFFFYWEENSLISTLSPNSLEMCSIWGNFKYYLMLSRFFLFLIEHITELYSPLRSWCIMVFWQFLELKWEKPFVVLTLCCPHW